LHPLHWEILPYFPYNFSIYGERARFFDFESSTKVLEEFSMWTTDDGSMSNQRESVSTWEYFCNQIIISSTWLIKVIFWWHWILCERLIKDI